MRAAGRFDALIEELGLAKSLETAEDDERIAEAADEDSGQDGPEGRRNLGPDHIAVLKMFGQIADVITALRLDVDELREEMGILKGRGGKPMAKAMQLPSGVEMHGEEFMSKALSAQVAGRLTGVQVAVAEACINAGRAPPRDIIAAVVAGAH